MFDYEKIKAELKERGFDIDTLGLPKHPMDEKIKPLVAALNYTEFSTFGSCEGHDKDGGINTPFVSMKNVDGNMPRLKRILRDYNRNTDIQWGLDVSEHLHWMRPLPIYHLSDMQASITHVAEFVYDDYRKSI